MSWQSFAAAAAAAAAQTPPSKNVRSPKSKTVVAKPPLDRLPVGLAKVGVEGSLYRPLQRLLDLDKRPALLFWLHSRACL